jgi:phosphoribosylglycinamide formyltransferase-1
MDTGPIIAQGAVPRLADDTVETLSARILSVEHQLLPMVVRWAAEGRLRLSDQGVELDLPPDEARWAWGG